MSGLWNVLGYDEIAFGLARALEDDSTIVVIEGPPGVGKSWLAKAVGGIWEDAGGRTVVAEGDTLRSDVPLYAIGFALAGLSSGFKNLGATLSVAANAGEALSGTAGVVGATVHAASQLRPSRRRAKAMYLGDAEQQVLFDLQRLAGDSPLLLIADNLHWWDAASLEFIDRCREPRMRSAFEFLDRMRVVCVQTEDRYQPVAHPQVRDAIFAQAQIRTIDLPRVSKGRFSEVLEALGAPAVTEDVAHAAYSLTGGHLALARRCAMRLAEGRADKFLAAEESGEFVSALLTQRVRGLGELGAQAVELLQIAATIGLRFRRDEVTCVWGDDDVETARLLRFLRDQDLIELEASSGAFVHEVYRRHFLGIDAVDRVTVHARLADCLRLLTPGDYVARARNALQAERDDEAACLAAQAVIAHQREGRDVESIPKTIRNALHNSSLRAVVEHLGEAIRLLNRDEYRACLESLGRLPHSLPVSLAAEVDYLRCSCLLNTRSDSDREAGRQIIAGWHGFEANEPELGIRLMSLHLFGLAMIVDKQPGRELEAQLRATLIQRVPFDSDAEDALYVLDRCSPSLYEPDVALLRVEAAVNHFEPRTPSGVVRRPIEYYRSLVNLAAERLASARFRESLMTCDRIEELVAEYAAGTFPRLEDPRSTAVTARLRLGELSTSDAVEAQALIVAEAASDEDPFYARNALAVYLALDHRFDEALANLDDMIGMLMSKNAPEPSMEYLLRANRCCTRFVAGLSGAHADEWRELAGVLEQVPYPITRFLIRRHELLHDVILTESFSNAVDFDACLVERTPPEMGPQWEQLGRGFRLPEVQWWH